MRVLSMNDPIGLRRLRDIYKGLYISDKALNLERIRSGSRNLQTCSHSFTNVKILVSVFKKHVVNEVQG